MAHQFWLLLNVQLLTNFLLKEDFYPILNCYISILHIGKKCLSTCSTMLFSTSKVNLCLYILYFLCCANRAGMVYCNNCLCKWKSVLFNPLIEVRVGLIFHSDWSNWETGQDLGNTRSREWTEYIRHKKHQELVSSKNGSGVMDIWKRSLGIKALWLKVKILFCKL